jgi:aspartate-semialdehyde dehydrogenase
MDANVPVIIPEVNPEHFAAIRDQDTYGSGGFIVANANCPTTGIAAPMKALDSVFGVREIFVSTYQALSGAGYPGVPSLDILGNVIPYIANEEEKMERELNKIMGGYDRGFQPAPFALTASCARVPVAEGHLESVVVRTEETPSADDVDDALSSFMGEPQRLSLPSAPEAPIIVRREEDRPQPKFDLMAGSPERARGMAVTVGRIRESDGYIKMFVFSHNTLRGGAGGSVLNAEFAYRTGLL